VKGLPLKDGKESSLRPSSVTWPSPIYQEFKRKENFTMISKMLILVAAVLMLQPAWAGAVSEKDFEAQTTEQLLNLCTVSPGDPLYPQAINFCQGYLVGAYKYYEAAHSGPNAPKFVCLPNPQPERINAIAMFIEWARAHPQYMKERPVDTEFRFLMEKWPCRP
jgi:hypothetical protein